MFGTVAERAQPAANRKNTCKLRKQLHQFYNTRAANAHDTKTNKETSLFVLRVLWQFSNKHHHWVRDNSWVQIIIIKVIYSLAREDLLVSNNTHELSQWGKTEREREREIDREIAIESQRDREPEIRSSKRAREQERAKGKQFWSVL